MRASIVAILGLAAEVALSVALPLPAVKFERSGVGSGSKRKPGGTSGPAPANKKWKPVDPNQPLFTNKPLPQRPPEPILRPQIFMLTDIPPPRSPHQPESMLSHATPLGPPQHLPTSMPPVQQPKPMHPFAGPPQPGSPPGSSPPGSPPQSPPGSPSHQPGSPLPPHAGPPPHLPSMPPVQQPKPMHPFAGPPPPGSPPGSPPPGSPPGSPSHQPGSPLPPHAGPPLQPQTTTPPLYQPRPLYAYAYRPNLPSLPESPPHSPRSFVDRSLGTSLPAPITPKIPPYSRSPTPPMSPYTPMSAPRSPPDSSPPSTPKSQHAPTTPSIVERELLEHVNQRIKLAARAYIEFMSHFSVPRVECVILLGICVLMLLLGSGFRLQWLMLCVSCLGLG